MDNLNTDIVKRFQFDLEMGRFTSRYEYNECIYYFRLYDEYEFAWFFLFLTNVMDFKDVFSTIGDGEYTICIIPSKKTCFSTTMRQAELKNELPKYFLPYIETFRKLYDVEYDGDGHISCYKKEVIEYDYITMNVNGYETKIQVMR